MAASPLSVVLEGGRSNLVCLHLCARAVKRVTKGNRQGSNIQYDQLGYRLLALTQLY